MRGYEGGVGGAARSRGHTRDTVPADRPFMLVRGGCQRRRGAGRDSRVNRPPWCDLDKSVIVYSNLWLCVLVYTGSRVHYPVAVNAAASVSDLARIASAVALGAAPVDELHATFLTSTVYCERAERPGFRALGAPGRGVVPVFSSLEQLAIARGPVAWFSLPGAELLDLLPYGYDILLDIGGATPLGLRSTKLRQHGPRRLGPPPAVEPAAQAARTRA